MVYHSLFRSKSKYKFLILALVVFLLISVGIPLHYTYADNEDSDREASAPVLILAAQFGDTVSGANEFVKIVNNTENYVDVTNWCIYYQPQNLDTPARKLVCFMPDVDDGRIIIDPYGIVTLMSTSFASNYPEYTYDYLFNVSIIWSGGYLYINDESGKVVDLLGWGNVSQPEGGLGSAAPNIELLGHLLRKMTPDGIYQDTNNNKQDFILYYNKVTSFETGMIRTTIDLCFNLDGVQEIIPEGYYLLDGDCVESNTPESDPGVESGDGEMPSPAIWLSELLPNPNGKDDGGEFIEIYNSTDQDIRLGGYKIVFGGSSSKVLYLTDDEIIPKNGYLVLWNSAYAFTMVNKSDSVALIAPNLTTISQTSYELAKDGKSWAYIDGEWQYTDDPTPGAINIIHLASVDLEAHGATLTPCSSGQYRNPETNRCRKIASTSQESTLIPCKEGQERNPETNRCRKILASDTPEADYSVLSETTAQESISSSYALLVMAAVVALGLLYIAWEWRKEIFGWLRTLAKKLRGAR